MNAFEALLKQATKEVWDTCPYFGSPVFEGYEVDQEKFAELIVQECCDLFVELRTRPADLAVLDVKKHFGVE